MMSSENMKKVIEILSEKMKQENLVVAIDGRCGAGKTTLSNYLASVYDASVVRMDDFFLPMELRSDERLKTPGGNIHYERFIKEVYNNIKNALDFKYRKFDCHIMNYSDVVSVPYKSLIIVEGVYSLHPLFEDLYNFKIFCDVDKNEQKRRIIERNGEEQYKVFENRWIPMEEMYFKEFNVKQRCDMVIKL